MERVYYLGIPPHTTFITHVVIRGVIMARIKKLPNESETQYNTRVQIEHISNIATRNERISWERKMDNMVKLLAKMRNTI